MDVTNLSCVRATIFTGKPMSASEINYGELMQAALKGVVRSALEIAATEGLPDRHHFYITFQTEHPGVAIASHLKAQYDEEMTIVLQHQFDALEIDDEGFGVTLRFNRRPERLEIPFDAVTAFVDPAVNFALHFQPQNEEGLDNSISPADQNQAPIENAQALEGASEPAEGGTVVSLDAFRNKK
jgi:hypothetical protein